MVLKLVKTEIFLKQVLDQTHVSSITFLATTEVFVDTAVPLFGEIDDLGETLQSVLILDPTEKTGALDYRNCSGGTITSFVISDGGSGYTSAPVSIGVTDGIGTIFGGIGITVNTNATAVAGLSGVGTVNSLTVTNGVWVYKYNSTSCID